MAVTGNMAVNNGQITTGIEILNRPPFEGIPITLDDDSFGETGVVKAGSLITAEGTTATAGADAIGVLLTDVWKERPQGTILKKAYVNLKRIKESLGDDYSTQYGDDISTVQSALPMVIFEEDPGE